MKVVIAGGSKGHSSGIVRKIQNNGHQIWKFNGYSNFEEFFKNVQSKIDEVRPHIIIWLVDFKEIPILNKPPGSLLLYGKYVGHREKLYSSFISHKIINETKSDGVIIIKPIVKNFYRFELVDKLGNYWGKARNFTKFMKSIVKLYEFYAKSNYGSVVHQPRLIVPEPSQKLELLIDMTTDLSVRIGLHYDVEDLVDFNLNYTRLYPSIREGQGLFVSKRNVENNFIEITDMVYIEDNTYFNMTNICAIDTPFHSKIYEKYPQINFIIHGHAYIKNVPYTKEYYDCGDINNLENLELKDWGLLNLKNHGFLIYTHSMQQLANATRYAELSPKLSESIV